MPATGAIGQRSLRSSSFTLFAESPHRSAPRLPRPIPFLRHAPFELVGAHVRWLRLHRERRRFVLSGLRERDGSGALQKSRIPPSTWISIGVGVFRAMCSHCSWQAMLAPTRTQGSRIFGTWRAALSPRLTARVSRREEPRTGRYPVEMLDHPTTRKDVEDGRSHERASEGGNEKRQERI